MNDIFDNVVVEVLHRGIKYYASCCRSLGVDSKGSNRWKNEDRRLKETVKRITKALQHKGRSLEASLTEGPCSEKNTSDTAGVI